LFEYKTPRALAAFVNDREAKKAEKSEEHAAAKTQTDDAAKKTSNPYERFDAILKANTLDAFRQGESNPLGDVVLTGSTGYLGIHILHDLLKNYKGHIYCPVRAVEKTNAVSRLKEYYYYYFGEDCFDVLDERVSAFDAQVTQPGALDDAVPDGLTVINCAANVKHFSQENDIETVNIDLVRRLIDFCKRKRSRLIHVSTTSIAGYSVDGHPAPDTKLREQDFWIGQNTTENRYVHSKFLAEELVLDAILNHSIKAKIMRPGNLSPRLNDGEFQINFKSNNSMAYLRAFAMLGFVPYDKLDEEMEFSPVDEVAHTILKLSQTPDACIVFHPYNTHSHYFSDILKGFDEAGIKIRSIEDDEFKTVLGKAMKNPEMAMMLRPLMAYDTDDEHEVRELAADNRYTTQVLYRMGYQWPLTAHDYVARFVGVLKQFGFFDDIDGNKQ